MEVLWILGILFTITTFVFVVIAVLFPEWVGITGKVAKRIEGSHREGSETQGARETDKK